VVKAEGELRRLLEVRVPELIEYQSERMRPSTWTTSHACAPPSRRGWPGETRLSEAVARYLFKLMAYKDEYEVARLHLKADLGRTLAEEFPGGVKVQYNLHPPLLRALGLERKLKFGRVVRRRVPRARPMKGLRGTALDPFGRAAVRRVERALPGEYRALVDRALADLSPGRLRAGGEPGAPARRGPRLRGHQAAQRRPFPRGGPQAERLRPAGGRWHRSCPSSSPQWRVSP
jgi:indolepyruvate ferredoxin oxidoreductase